MKGGFQRLRFLHIPISWTALCVLLIATIVLADMNDFEPGFIDAILGIGNREP